MQNIPRQTIVSARLTEREKEALNKVIAKHIDQGLCKNPNQWMRKVLMDAVFPHVPESMRKRLLKG